MRLTALDGWRDYVRTHDEAALWALLHPDVVFESPILRRPQSGREIAFKYIRGAGEVLGGPAFKFVGEWRSAGGGVLEFETEIDGIQINGVDIVTCSEDGRLITRFKVMIRPLKAINLVAQLMSEQLAKA